MCSHTRALLLRLLVLACLLLTQCHAGGPAGPSTSGDERPASDEDQVILVSHSSIFQQLPYSLLLQPNKTSFDYPNHAKSPKKQNKHDGILRQTESQCRKQCTGKKSFEELSCVRNCSDHACYTEIYGFNTFEAGEVDIRQLSFRNCALMRIQEREEKTKIKRKVDP